MSSPSGRALARGLLRPLLPFLLVAAASEMIIARVLSAGGMFWVRRLSLRARQVLDLLDQLTFTFSFIMALGLLVLLGFLASTLRFSATRPSWWVGPGLVLVALWSSLGAALPRLTPFYHGLSLLLALGMLAAFFSGNQRGAPRAFAVLLSASLTCSAYAVLAEMLPPEWTLPWRHAALQAGELIALVCGALAVALIPDGHEDPHSFPHAVLAALPAGLYVLLDLRAAGAADVNPRWDLGWMRDLPLPDRFDGLIYAGAMFLFLFGLLRALGNPRFRLRGYGLGFLFLAGIHYRIPYQHLLGLIGLVLLTGGAPDEEPAKPLPAAAPAAV